MCKKKLREDWREKWYDAAESESYSSIGIWESYAPAIINYHTVHENSRAPVLTKRFHVTYTAERRLKIMNQKNRNIACSAYWKGIK